jgi:phosphodiesterase/alkaline phosphatase D-like protein
MAGVAMSNAIEINLNVSPANWPTLKRQTRSKQTIALPATTASARGNADALKPRQAIRMTTARNSATVQKTKTSLTNGVKSQP